MARVQTNIVPKEKKTFSQFIMNDTVQKQLVKRVGGDMQTAARFTATVMQAVNGNKKLAECEPATIMNAALHGEIAMNLSYALGQYAIVPYGTTATYQIQVKGLEQLCIRSGKYAAIKCFDVREGEFVGYDKKTRDPIIKWIEDDDERENRPIVGYYAFYILNEENNGFFNCLYWTHKHILKHANRYSQAFNLNYYEAIMRGETPKTDKGEEISVEKLQSGSPWYRLPDDDGHIAMCKKTVLKQLLNDGFAPKAIQEIVIQDNYVEKTEHTPVFDDFDTVPSPTEPIIAVDSETGEVISESAERVSAASAPQTANHTAESADAEKPQRSAANSAKKEKIPTVADFFDD